MRPDMIEIDVAFLLAVAACGVASISARYWYRRWRSSRQREIATVRRTR